LTRGDSGKQSRSIVPAQKLDALLLDLDQLAADLDDAADRPALLYWGLRRWCLGIIAAFCQKIERMLKDNLPVELRIYL